jgi:PRA1 family protein
LQRPWNSFFGAFDLPKGWPQLEKRLVANLLHYRTNYISIVAVVFLWAFFRSLAMAMAFTVLLPLWLYAYGARKQPIVIGEKRLSKDETLYALLGITFVILWLSSSIMSTILSLFIGCGLCFLHATTRPPTMLSKLNRAGFNLKTAIFGSGSGSGSSASSSNDEDDDESFEVRDIGEGFKALLGMGKKRRGGASSAAAVSKKASGGRGHSDSGNIEDVEGRAPVSGNGSSSGRSNNGSSSYASPFMMQPPNAPAPVASGPVAGFYSGSPALPPNTIPGSSSSMPLYYDAPLQNGAGAADFDDGLGHGNGGLHGPRKRGGAGGGGAANLPRPGDVKTA